MQLILLLSSFTKMFNVYEIFKEKNGYINIYK
jgi:hypothetical protein